MEKLKQALSDWRIITLLVFILFALVAIRPQPWNEGVSIRSVAFNSSAAEAGMLNPKQHTAPLNYELITSIDGQQIISAEDYYKATVALLPNQTLEITTDKAVYILKARPLFNETILNETEPAVVEVFDNATNSTINKTIRVPKVHRELIGTEEIGIKVAQAATSNIRKGLDLAGGSRVLLKPDEEISIQDIDSIIQSLTERLNIYGLSDIVVRDATDLSGTKYISIEIAGATEDEVRELVGKQGKFEAKIANQTVFIGGKSDISYVCRTAECSGLDSRRACGKSGEGVWGCGFFFSIALGSDAAQRHADITRGIKVISEGRDNFLQYPLELYLDDKLVDTLRIGADLKGRVTTNVAITGGGAGRTQQEAAEDALKNMKRLQAVLQTGSLPTKLSIVKIDTISPTLGREFLNNVIIMAVAAFVSVCIVVTLRYRRLKITLPMIGTMLAEIVLILGFAALVGWNLDLAAMAGIIISIGTAVDHLIIIADETLRGEVIYDFKKRIKNALFIIFGAYLTVVSGMIPLWFAGAGLLKGFAFTTIAGVSFGVLIARPAYAALIRIFLKG